MYMGRDLFVPLEAGYPAFARERGLVDRAWCVDPHPPVNVTGGETANGVGEPLGRGSRGYGVLLPGWRMMAAGESPRARSE